MRSISADLLTMNGSSVTMIRILPRDISSIRVRARTLIVPLPVP